MPKFISIHNLSFTYENCHSPLFESVSFQLQTGWTGIVGANGSGKTTLLKLLTNRLTADSGKKIDTGTPYYCEQRTDFVPDGFKQFLSSTDKASFRIKRNFKIDDSWIYRWDKLSHGERKCCQIATALFLEPSTLAIDEPSNHLDYSSKKILYTALKLYKGIGLLVSHDREMLDNLCQQTLFISPPKIDIKPCPYSQAKMEIEREERAKLHAYHTINKEIKKLKKKVVQQKEKADQTDKKRSKRGLGDKDHDAKSKIDQARLTGKDAVAGRIAHQAKNRLDKSLAQKRSLAVNKNSILGIKFEAERYARFFPMILHPHTIVLGGKKQLTIPELNITFCDKIGLIGDNGSGKSTLLTYITSSTKLPADQLIYIPQEISEQDARWLVNRIRDYNRGIKGQLMTIINRLGSDPKQVLQTTTPSPGEVRKLMLAEGIRLNPALIIMDEPTNHMDLPSINCIEQALAECNCAQLLVSHDHVFLQHIVDHYWSFESADKDKYIVRCQY